MINFLVLWIPKRTCVHKEVDKHETVKNFGQSIGSGKVPQLHIRYIDAQHTSSSKAHKFAGQSITAVGEQNKQHRDGKRR